MPEKANCEYCDNGDKAGSGFILCVCLSPCWNPDCQRVRFPIDAPTRRLSPAEPPSDALAQWVRERGALVQCARALAFSYAGSPRPPETEPEARAMWDAMHLAYDVLGVTDTRNIPGTANV